MHLREKNPEEFFILRDSFIYLESTWAMVR